MEPDFVLADTATAVGGAVAHAILLELKRHGPVTTGPLTTAAAPFGPSRQAAVDKVVKRLLRDDFLEIAVKGPPAKYALAPRGEAYLDAMALGANGIGKALRGSRLLIAGAGPSNRRSMLEILKRSDAICVFETDGDAEFAVMLADDLTALRDLDEALVERAAAKTSNVRLSGLVRPAQSDSR